MKEINKTTKEGIGDVPKEVQDIANELGQEKMNILVAYIQERLNAKIKTNEGESVLESIYESAEFKIIEDKLYEQYVEEDLPKLKSLIEHYLKARGDEDLLEKEAWHIYNFIQANTKLDNKSVAYDNIISKLNS